MRRLEKLPPAFGRFEAMLGVLDFAVFEDAEGSDEEVLSAVSRALGDAFPCDMQKLRALGSRRIPERVFFGDWYDHASGMLLHRGRLTTKDGLKLRNPPLTALNGLEIRSASAEIPEPGAGGQFAYAFSWTPYRLQGPPSEVQAVFEEIRDFILPPRRPSEISDWTDVRLAEVSDYFAAGMEWWGVFLFSIYIPSLRRLTIIAGSTTD